MIWRIIPEVVPSSGYTQHCMKKPDGIIHDDRQMMCVTRDNSYVERINHPQDECGPSHQSQFT